jgi:hypothetical protein
MNDPQAILHVISFDVPWPADYGGVMDVYYKLKALHRAGVRIILHCFRYGRPQAPELEEICAEVHYYQRNTRFGSQISGLPYIVRSRTSEALARRLLQDQHPILCEGLHTSFIFNDKRFSGRKILVRTTNVEHEYYRHLAMGERNVLKKSFFRLEAIRLKLYEKVLKKSYRILAISPNDEKYFSRKFGTERVMGVYAFHQYDEVLSQPGKGDFFLYHGKLDVAENFSAVLQMLPLFEQWQGMPLWIAGMNPPPFLVKSIAKVPHVRLIADPDPATMQQLIRDAHAHLLLTAQPTGLKLKLLAALFQGRFVIVNPIMVEGTGLEPLCFIGNNPEDLNNLLKRVETKEFLPEEIAKRNAVLNTKFSNAANAMKIKGIL